MPEHISLLFLPGLLCDERLWQDQAASLTKVADPLIADLTLDESIAAMARRALAAAPDRFALAALSMGGYVAFEILRQAPERVSRLALLATSAAPDTARLADGGSPMERAVHVPLPHFLPPKLHIHRERLCVLSVSSFPWSLF